MTTMAHEPRTPPLNSQFQQWAFEKSMLEAEQRSPSESSSAEFYEAEEKVRIKPNLEELKRTIEEQKSPAMFNEKYMSSEEALSPTDQECEESDDGSIHEGETSIKFAVCDMAVAICIISVGKAKVVDVPIPSLTSSPSVGSEVERPERIDSMPRMSTVPRKPVLRERNPHRPVSRPLQSRNSYSDIHTQAIPEIPTHTFNPSDEIDSQHSSMLRTFTTQPIAYSLSREIPSPYSTAHPSFLSQDPFADSPPPRTQHSRLRSLSQKIGRFALYGPSGKPADETGQDSEPFKVQKVSTSNNLHQDSLQPQSQAPEVLMTPEPSSVLKRKMIPRGAAERAPPIEIPPCPYDLDDDTDLVPKQERVRRRKSLIGF